MTLTDSVILGGRYVLGEVIGRGGMAEVRRATDRILDRAVAVKVLRDGAPDDGERARFTAEARMLASLNHPGLVTLLDAGIDDEHEHPYLVMELVEGPTLSELGKDAPLEPDRVALMGCQIAEALAYAHQRGVVHRDVKPSNILVCAGDRVLLADFGIARLLSDAARHTRTGDTIGSPAYLAPEQVTGDELSGSADVYSLGLVLLEALTGMRAYQGTPVEAAVARLTTQPTIPVSLAPGWRTLLARMTHRDAADRPPAGEVATALAALRSDPLKIVHPDDEAPGVPAVETGPLELDATLVGDALAVPHPSGVSGRHLPVIAVVLVAILLLVALVLFRPHGGTAPPPAELPAGVPTQLRGPLTNLHDAIDGIDR